jgi:ApaG protein
MYVPERSDPARGQYFFAYEITIANVGDASAMLTHRHWIITDGTGHVEEVEGEGVVGHTPHLEPGQEFRYTSFCPLSTPVGTMEGSYLMVRDDGETFEAAIAPFTLATPHSLN